MMEAFKQKTGEIQTLKEEEREKKERQKAQIQKGEEEIGSRRNN